VSQQLRSLLCACCNTAEDKQKSYPISDDYLFSAPLSGKTYLNLIQKLKKQGWQIELYYLWLPSIEFSAQRVQERVEHGGHHIPLQDIQRRYPKGIYNLMHHYAPLCDSLVCFDNSSLTSETIFIQQGSDVTVSHKIKFEQLKGVSNAVSRK